MREAKPQDSSTVKGFRTSTPGDIKVLNWLKDVSCHFLNLLDTSKKNGADPVDCYGKNRNTEGSYVRLPCSFSDG